MLCRELLWRRKLRFLAFNRAWKKQTVMTLQVFMSAVSGNKIEGLKVNRATDSTCCLPDLWATYHSPKWWTVTPRVTGLHLPASHYITKDSAHGDAGGGHAGGRSEVRGSNVPSGDRTDKVRGHADILDDRLRARRDPFGANEDVASWRRHVLR